MRAAAAAMWLRSIMDCCRRWHCARITRDKLLPFPLHDAITVRLMHSQRRLHGSCVSRDGDACCCIGPPGRANPTSLLRLLARGFDLVADDQVDIADGVASGPAELAGLLEVRGLGIVRLPYAARRVWRWSSNSDGRRRPPAACRPPCRS